MLKRILPLILCLAPLAVSAAPTQIKLATLAPENSSWMREMRAGAKEIAERTEQRVRLKFYGGGVMGNDKKVLRKMRIGQLHGGSFTPSGLSERCPDFGIYGQVLTFDSLEEVAYVRERMDAQVMAALEAADLVGFGVTGGGFALIMSQQPVTRYEDLKGRKMWVPEGDLMTFQAMKSLDLSPVVLPITDVLTGLQTGLIDIIGTPPVGAIALQWYTKVDYVTDFPIVYAYAALVIEKKIMDRLRPEDRAVVDEVMHRIYKKFDHESQLENASAREAMVANGINFVQPDSGAISSWRDRVIAANLAQVEDGMLSKGLFEELSAHISDFRAAAAAQVAVDGAD
ncbi:MAG: TRAP transporter substrate-binding protein DctP [Gammaproteobacteria bacterium]